MSLFLAALSGRQHKKNKAADSGEIARLPFIVWRAALFDSTACQ